MVYALNFIKYMRDELGIPKYRGFDLSSINTEMSAYVALNNIRIERLEQSGLPEDGRLIISRILHPKDSSQDKGLGYMTTTESNDSLLVDFDGIVGSRKYNTIRDTNGRDFYAFPNNVKIRNHRQLFALSKTDAERISERLGVEVTPELLGVNIELAREDGEPFELTTLPYGFDLQVFKEGTEYLPKQFTNPKIFGSPGGAPREDSGFEALLRVQSEQMGCIMTATSLGDSFRIDGAVNRRLIEEFKGIHRFENRGTVLSLESTINEQTPTELRAGQVVYVRPPSGWVF